MWTTSASLKIKGLATRYTTVKGAIENNLQNMTLEQKPTK